MVQIGETYFHLDAPSLDQSELKRYATSLFRDFDDTAGRLLPLADYEIHLDIEEGSIKGKGAIYTALGFFVMGVANFGSFVQGVREISAIAKSVGDSLIDAAPQRLYLPKSSLKWRRNDSAKLGRLERLFEDVKRGRLEPDAATAQVIELLGEDDEVSTDLAKDVESAVKQIKLDPQQLDLPLQGLPSVEEIKEMERNQGSSRKPVSIRDKAVLPANKLRVEVWRKGKDGRTHVRIIPL